MTSLNSLIEQYRDGPRQLQQAVAGLSREQLLARPIAGKWSTLEVVAHLADFEPILADRMKRVIAEEKPALIGADENKFAAALAYDERDVQEELSIIAMTRSQLARILRGQTDAVLQRVGVHSERGPKTLEQLLESAINHIPHHVKYIHEKRAALGISA